MEYQRFCREPPNFLCLSIGSWGRARPRGRFQGNKGRLALSSDYAGPYRAWSRRTCARERIHTFAVESPGSFLHTPFTLQRDVPALVLGMRRWFEKVVNDHGYSFNNWRWLEMDNLDSRCNTAVIPIGAQVQQGKIHRISQIISPRTVSGNNVLVCVIIALRM